VTDQRRIIFIVGNSRSGTTMLGRVLGNHSRVHTFGELHFFEHQVDAATVCARSFWRLEKRFTLIEKLMTSSRDGFFAKLVPGKYRNEAERVLADVEGEDPVSAYKSFLHYESRRNGKSIPCEQTPRYLFFVKEILDAFPEARVINMVRDPRDVLLSQKNKWRRRFLGAKNIPLSEALRAWVNYHPYTISRLWVAAVHTAKRFEGNPRFVSIRFEDLLQQPETSAQSLCSFIGITFEPDMLKVPQVGSSTGMDKPEQKGIDGSRSGGWRKGGLTDVELAICQHVAAKELSSLGYVAEPMVINEWRRWMSMSDFAFKILLALLLNLRRTKNLRETLRRRLVKQDLC
jgi:hypothetical protein